MKKLLFVLTLVVFCLLNTSSSYARDNVSDWYIKSFKTNIDVRDDSSLYITENILADCGNNQRHGIFRTIPLSQNLDGKTISSPIELDSITDQSGKKLKYSTTKDTLNKTITWKIGDEDKFVTGENTYVIKYLVKNAVRHQNDKFDELYWNLSGNFWLLEIDNFEASVNFPDRITKNNLSLNYYSGYFGDKNPLNISGTFSSDNQLKISYDKTLLENQGITLSASFPKDIIAPYKPSFIEKYGNYFLLLIPLFILWLCVKLWKRYGDDPSINPTIAPEFEIPEKLAPIEMGILQTDGLLRNNFVTASIINLAVNGRIQIKKIDKKGVFGKEDFELNKLESKYKASVAEEKLLSSLFGKNDSVKMSSLQNKFYKNLSSIGDAASEYLAKNGYLVRLSRLPQWIMLFIGIFILVFSMGGFAVSPFLGIAMLLSAIILIIFSFIMPRRTAEGARLMGRVRGFKLYLDKVEKYRQQVLEKKDTFEKMLPYAILFGMTKEYIRKMKDIYGEDYFSSYHPAWYYYGAAGSFNVDRFSNQISSLSSSMASTISSSPSSSGAGGGGFSGGGGGGGGGGGW